MPAATTRRPRPGAASGVAELSGLGPRSQAMLAAAGIRSVAQPRRLGATRADLRVQAAVARPGQNLLWAPEGALSGRPWRDVARTERTRLLLDLEDRQAPRWEAEAP